MFLIILPRMTVNHTYTSYEIIVKLVSLGCLKKALYEFYNYNVISSYKTWPLIVGSVKSNYKSIYDSCINSLKYDLVDSLGKNGFDKRLSVNAIRKNKDMYIQINYIQNTTTMSIQASREKINIATLIISNVFINKFDKNIMAINGNTFKVIRMVEKYISKFIKPVSTGVNSALITSLIHKSQHAEMFGLYRWLTKAETLLLSKDNKLDAGMELVSLYYSIDE